MQDQPDQKNSAIYFDGASNRKHRITLRMGTGLELIEDGRRVGTWLYPDIRRVDGPHGRMRVRSVGALPLARVEFENAAMEQTLAARCPSLEIDRGGTASAGRIVLWSLGAICSIIAVAYYGIPVIADRLAPYVPAQVVARIGEAVDTRVRAIFGDKVCEDAEGRAAFAKLVDKLKRAGGVQAPFDAQALYAAMPNAFALPGGKIYLFDGLLQKAQNADEIAGVIAHELGHVHHRDTLRKLIQTGGTSFLIGLLFGDVVGGGAVVLTAQSMLDASYSRQAEQRADDFSVQVMHKLGRSPKPMGELLMRITGAQGKKSPTILASHPISEDRLAAMQKQDRPVTGEALLSPREWFALKNICGRGRRNAREPSHSEPSPNEPTTREPNSREEGFGG
jgi:Zn-dependent protease with chaperone function